MCTLWQEYVQDGLCTEHDKMKGGKVKIDVDYKNVGTNCDKSWYPTKRAN